MEAALGVSATALSGMLQILQRKGRVERLPAPLKCHGCTHCEGKALEFYRWTGTWSAEAGEPAAMDERSISHSCCEAQRCNPYRSM